MAILHEKRSHLSYTFNPKNLPVPTLAVILACCLPKKWEKMKNHPFYIVYRWFYMMMIFLLLNMVNLKFSMFLLLDFQLWNGRATRGTNGPRQYLHLPPGVCELFGGLFQHKCELKKPPDYCIFIVCWSWLLIFGGWKKQSQETWISIRWTHSSNNNMVKKGNVWTSDPFMATVSAL